MTMFRRRSRKVPGLNTASLPDLIFSVLFFFMIVTHMRKVALKVKYTIPQGTELTRLVKKSAVSYIYIGTPLGTDNKETHIQCNDKYVAAKDISGYISAERSRMAPEDLEQMTVCIMADKDTKMRTITQVKQALRKSGALNISYSASEKQ